ncbi:MAG: DUF4177 domain-containing protein [Chloroherpetonaceae bacterium]|nr:DUF4177 domain-containing protein [Chloroherpetonaceae bacterium]
MAFQYEYKFVPIKQKWTGSPKENYLSMIEDMGRQGWRFISLMGPERAISLGFTEPTLVFEKVR